MSEKNQLGEVGWEAQLQYGGENASTYYADARRQLYKYAVDGVDIWKEIEKSLDLLGDESILDVGASRGLFLRQLRSSGHSGGLLGVDIHPDLFEASQILDKDIPEPSIDLDVGDATKLSLEFDYADVVSSLFLGYHLDKPELAINEFKRVLRPGGKLVVATRNIDNHERMWRLAGHVADRVGAPRPKSFYSHFDMVKARRMLVEAGFLIESEFLQATPLHIPMDHTPGDREGWRDYRNALLSLRPAMVRTIGDVVPSGVLVSRIIDQDVWSIFQKEVAKNSTDESPGYFVDWAEQGFFVCKNTKDGGEEKFVEEIGEKYLASKEIDET